MKARQLWSGSAPRRIKRSLSSSSRPAAISITGQSMLAFTPSTMCMIGRRARWSISHSVSNSMIVSAPVASIRCPVAAWALAPASIQPSKWTISTGSSRSGARRTRKRSLGSMRELIARIRARIGCERRSRQRGEWERRPVR